MAAQERWQRRVCSLSAQLKPCSGPGPHGTLSRVACRAEQASKPAADKVVTAAEAVALVKSGDCICVCGFVGLGIPVHLLNALSQRFERSSQPQGLTLINVAVGGTAQGRGLNVLAKQGLISKYIYAWSGLSPGFQKLAEARKLEAWNLPLGVVSHMIRDVAAKRIGPVTKTGLNTFVDPREQGGKYHPEQADMVHLVELGGQQLLWYQAPKRIDVALLRGTSADADGNISVEHEAAYADLLNQAMAAHNSGGIVIVQVLRLVERGSLSFRGVHIPGALVTKVVVAPAEEHWQSMESPHMDGSLSGEVRHPAGSLPPLPMSARRIIAYRAMLAISGPSIINLGVGMPEGVASVVASHAAQDMPHVLPLTLTTEVGLWGGTPAGGLRFGAAVNGVAAVPCATMIDFYQGGGVDLAILGLAQADAEGNVNVSRFADRAPGAGGFIDISQNAKACVFVGTFTSGGLKVAVKEGKLHIVQEGRERKFVRTVLQKTFGGASVGDRRVLYVTERAVLAAHDGGMQLLEIAPGIDLERDVLGQMDFRPHMTDVPTIMDSRCFHA